ncbi:hypothetical protein Tsubulata_047284 [Turnera subulata]|uniref:C3H1-type domain-containing protein n=1 Tax=Turnera subulata TaxID=218843 RepID=A0A9Q0F959_9ROSI|nr:hypothetical protein Tsubulata_047284 [Turnera subulata]
MHNGNCSTGHGDDATITAAFPATACFDYLLDDAGFSSSSAVIEPPQSDSGFLMHHQDLINRIAMCLVRLREAAREAELLRRENASLRSLNRELTNRLNFLIKKHCEEYYFNTALPQQPQRFDLASGFRKACNVYDQDDYYYGAGEETEDDGYGESPTSVMEESSSAGRDERVSLPKSISVRSSGYVKASQATAATAGSAKATPPPTAAPSSLTGPQKVYIRGRNKEEEEEALELEVYKQGATKTELCNKWQETGACPYGDQCQFAHGIKELRPVIRHPRYKTEVCRMILSGDTCPYGHRCHFRHALTDQEKLLGRQRKPSSTKPSSEVN